MKTEPEIRTWGQALDYDLKRNKSHGRDKSSYKNILSHCNYFTSLYGRSYPCKRITQDVMDDFIEELQQERSVSDATANRYMATIKAVLNYAHSKKKLPHPYKFSKLTEKPGRPEWYDKKTIDEYERVARSNLFYRNNFFTLTTLKRVIHR